MRRLTNWVLLLFAFTIPWEYSLDLGEPWGNIARLTGLIVLALVLTLVLAKGRVRRPGLVLGVTLSFFLWLCCTAFWTVDTQATLERLRAMLQETIVVWFVWELCEDEADLHRLLIATLAGCWLLAALTCAEALSAHIAGLAPTRFSANGQDPNDAARLLDFGFPLAALLFDLTSRRVWRVILMGYFPAGLIAVVLTASRGGLLTATVALAGAGALLAWHHPRRMVAGILLSPLLVGFMWLLIPAGPLERLATIPDQLRNGDLNQRINIWDAGWRSFVEAPWMGYGAGTFVTATGLATGATAHDTALSLMVESGLIGMALGLALLVVLAREAMKTRGSMRVGLCTMLAVWGLASLVGTLDETRMTWLLFGIIALAGRVNAEAVAGRAEASTMLAGRLAAPLHGSLQ
jgi:hypothetical protein